MRIALLFISLVVGPAAVADVAPREGKDYTVIQSAVVDKSSKIVVTEFFSYQCPHCFAFSKPLYDWSTKLPADVQFERKAVSIGHPQWVDIARTYYTLQAMGSLEALDTAIFNAVHQQGVRLDGIAYIMGWLNQRKVAITDFDAAYRSAKVREAFALGEQLTVDYKIPSVPTMVVDGKYVVLIVNNVPYDQQLANVDKVIALARADRAK